MRFRFRDFELDTDEVVLRCEGDPVKIEPKPLLLLVHLARRHPASVSKEELLHALWPNEYVAEGSLTRAVHVARQALGPAGRPFLKTIRGYGYQLSGAVSESPTSPAAPPADRPFVGRAAELEALSGQLADAEHAKGAVSLLSGEPGIGKTRVAEEVSKIASDRGFEVAWGSAREGEGAPALWPWVQVLRSLVRARDPVRLAQELGRGVPEIAAQVPEVVEKLPKIRMPKVLPAQDQRFRLFDSVAQFLARASMARPLLLIVEDLHAVDAASLRLLCFAAAELSAARVALLATYRHVGASRSSDLENARAELRRLPNAAAELRLPGLNVTEASSLLTALGREAGASPEIEALVSRTAGNPFYLLSLARASSPGRQANLRESLEHRLSSVGKVSRCVLEIAAVLGRDFEIRLLTTVLGKTADAAWPALEEAERAGLVAPVPQRSVPTWSFVHALVQEACYEALGTPRKAELHLLCADAIEERQNTRETEQGAPEIAHHLLLHVRNGDPPEPVRERAVRSLLRAAEEAAARTAFESAAQLLESAAELASSRRRRLRYLFESARAWSAAGALENANARAQETIDSTQHEAHVDLMADALLLMHDLNESPIPKVGLAGPLREALAMLPPGDFARRARILGALSSVLYWEGDRSKAKELRFEAIRSARKGGDRRLILELLDPVTLGVFWNDAELRSLVEEKVAIAERLGDPVCSYTAELANLHWEMRRGEVPRILTQAERLTRSAERLGTPRHAAAGLRASAAIALWRGDLARAEELAKAALREGRRSDSVRAMMAAGIQMFWILRFRGDHASLETAAREGVERWPAVRTYRVSLGLLLADRGRLSEARSQLEAADLRSLPEDTMYALNLAMASELCASVGDAQLAEHLYSRLERLHPILIHSLEDVALGSSGRFLGLLSRHMGRLDAAETWLEEACAFEVRASARPFEALGCYELAQLLVERGGPGDHERGRRHLGRALAIAREVGMIPLARRAERLFGQRELQ